MNGPTESRLLRLAIARGLLAWEDLDAVAGQGEGLDETHWIAALVAAGRLDAADVDHLAAELSPFPPELRFLADWSRYRVERFLGSGGMGAVYLASDPALDRRVALKFLHQNDPEQTARFLREARAQARVDHPHICPVHEVGEVRGRPYIAMRYLEGKSLSELRGKLAMEQAARLVRDVARAVHAAHRTGLIHRDLKPANILVDEDEAGALHPWVVDFGLALDLAGGDRAGSRTGVISGTPAYLSPEQARGEILDRRSDVYSLGVVLHELLCGEPPFLGPGPAATLIRLLEEEPKPLRQLRPAVPADLETIVLKCLDKEPERRYDSARALADELDRFLDGEPIQARPTGWAGRVARRARKHRALTAAAAAAALALLVLGGLLLRARWEAAERAGIAQRFGQRVEAMRSNLRYAALLPRHDITASKQQLRRELEEIQTEMRRLGPLAEAPGHFALGQGFLALHQHDLAREHLQKAWDAGERSPEVAAALGRVLGLLYERNLVDFDRHRTADQEEIRRTLHGPALSYLRLAAERTRSDPYLQGLVAFYEERFPEAAARAREAARRAPWLFEAVQLEAEVYLAQADRAINTGRSAEAFRLYERAGGLYRQLLARVPSEASLYAAECQRQANQVYGESPEELSDERVRTALAACDLALEVDPGLGEALFFQAAIHGARGRGKLRRGIDPTADLGAAVRAAERAIALNPRDARPYKHLANALRELGSWQMSRGIDPSANLRRAVAAAREGVRLQPNLPSPANALGIAWLALAEDQQRRGLDARQAVGGAVRAFRDAVARNPLYLFGHINLGTAWNKQAEAQIARGQDPAASLEKAAAAFQQAARLSPDEASIHNNLGNTYLTLGEYLLTRGADPRRELERAAAGYRRSLALQPAYAYGPYNLAYTRRVLAQTLLERKEDPAAALAEARSHLEESLRRNPADADTFLERGRIEIIAGRWAALRGRSEGTSEGTEGAAFRQADSALRQAEALNPGAPEIFFAQAVLERHRAEAELARGGRPAGVLAQRLARGLERIGRALAINSGEARYLAEEGALQRLAARLETDPDRRRDRAERAAAALRKALAMNPLLEREYGSSSRQID